LILLCDQWRIGQQDLQHMVQTWKDNPAVPVVARWQESYGSPAIFPRLLYGELQQLQGDRGAKALITKQLLVHFADIPNAQYDLDTEADLEVMRSLDQRQAAMDVLECSKDPELNTS
jgi:molybdenum cofactor cytidylyltransferase